MRRVRASNRRAAASRPACGTSIASLRRPPPNPYSPGAASTRSAARRHVSPSPRTLRRWRAPRPPPARPPRAARRAPLRVTLRRGSHPAPALLVGAAAKDAAAPHIAGFQYSVAYISASITLQSPKRRKRHGGAPRATRAQRSFPYWPHAAAPPSQPPSPRRRVPRFAGTRVAPRRCRRAPPSAARAAAPALRDPAPPPPAATRSRGGPPPDRPPPPLRFAAARRRRRGSRPGHATRPVSSRPCANYGFRTTCCLIHLVSTCEPASAS